MFKLFMDDYEYTLGLLNNQVLWSLVIDKKIYKNDKKLDSEQGVESVNFVEMMFCFGGMFNEDY